MSPGIPKTLRNFFPLAVLVLTLAGAQAQQTLSVDSAFTSSTNSLQPVPKTWKENMLDRQLHGGLKKSWDFDSSSFGGITVNPSSTSQKTETSAEKKRREMLDQRKHMIFIGNDPPQT